MYNFHKDKEKYFNYQFLTTRDYIIPFIEDYIHLIPSMRILEIGCAEAGVLKAFTERGHICTGIELSKSRVEIAKEFMKGELEDGKISFITKNVYDINVEKEFDKPFDIILLKDVIEHIPDQQKFLSKLSHFMAPSGKVFFAFPPWQMPFGGHQQMLKNKFLSSLPYFHLFPSPFYRRLMKAFGESDQKINNILDIKKTGISIERFKKIISKENYSIKGEKLFLFNPIYKYKYKLKPKTQGVLIAKIPYVRDFLTTASYFLIEKGK